MIPSGEPPRPSSRSLYERLGISPTLNVSQRKVPPVTRPTRPAKWKWMLTGGLLLVTALSWYNIAHGPVRIGDAGVVPDEDRRRMDAQQAQIQLLDQRVEMLEIKVRALQELAGYQTLDDRHLPAVRDPLVSPIAKKKRNIPKP